MVQLDELAKRLQFDFEPRATLVTEVAELDKRVERLSGGWEWPIGNHIKFRLGGAVAVAG